MDRICSDKYWPSQVDVLRARIRTQGVIETHFKINGIKFRFAIDVDCVVESSCFS